MADHYQAHPSHGRVPKDPFEQRIRDPLNHNQMRDPFDFPQFFNNGRNLQDPHMFRSPRRSFPSPHHGFDDGFHRGFNVEDSPSSMFPRHEPGHHVESIPITVIHEKSPSQNATRPSTSENSPPHFQQKQQQHHHHPFTGGRKTTEIPLPSSHLEPTGGSPRLERAHSEPPKSFHQRMSTLHPPQPIPERQDEDPHPITTSASAPSVPGETTALPEHPHQVSNEPTKFSSSPTNSSPPPSQNANPQIRHIPIVVEGRDVPVFNRKLSDKPNTRPKVDPSQPPKSQTEPTTPQGPPPGPIPMGCSADHLKPVEPSSPLPLPEGPIPLPCSPNLMQEKEKKEKLCEKKIDDVDNSFPPEKGTPQETNNVVEEKAAAAATAAQGEPKDPALEKVKSIQDNLAQITRRIEEFKGSKKDKEYLYLDEMLTRHLLSLDGIDSGGKEEIRKIRKESIKSVNRCLSLLDSKTVPSDR